MYIIYKFENYVFKFLYLIKYKYIYYILTNFNIILINFEFILKFYNYFSLFLYNIELYFK